MYLCENFHLKKYIMKTLYSLKVAFFGMLLLWVHIPLSAQSIYIQLINGEEQTSFELAHKPKITFSARNLVIETPTTQSTYSLEEIQNLSFVQQTGSSNPGILNPEGKIRLFPNPVKDEFRLDIQIPTEGLRYRMYDMLGVMLQRGDLDTSTSIDIRNYRPGFYILRLEQNGRELQSFKIVKQ